jgi:hypothetical protein
VWVDGRMDSDIGLPSYVMSRKAQG